MIMIIMIDCLLRVNSELIEEFYRLLKLSLVEAFETVVKGLIIESQIKEREG